MKTPYIVGLVTASVLITLAIEETRIASLRTENASKVVVARATTAESPARTPAPRAMDGTLARTRRETGENRIDPPKPAEPKEESLMKSVRKMWDNPAGKSMMNQGVKVAVAMMYEDFIKDLGLSKEEEDYFKTLLGKEMSGQQEIGMKMMGASAEERKTLVEEMKQRKLENDDEIKKFLNDDEDFKLYSDYKERLPERQQLDGIRSAMEAKGAPLDADTETRLVDAMYRARTESNAPDLSGPDAIEHLTKGNLVESFEQSWEIQQEALGSEVSGILNPVQLEAFKEHQKQVKEMQLMGLKMAEKMMENKPPGSE